MKRSVLLFTPVLLSSCATSIQTNGGKLISPEAQGDTFRGTFNATSNYASSYKLNFTTNQTGAPLVHENSGREMGFASEIGIVNSVDLIAALGSETEFGLKWQFLGDSRSGAKGGSFSASLVGIYSRATRNADLDDDSENVPANVRKIEMEKNSTSIGLLAGYRIFDPFLLYAGVFRVLEDVDGKVTTVSYGLNDSAFSYSNKADIKTLGFIYYSQSNFVTKVELSTLETKWTNSDKRSDNGWSVGLGFVW